MIANSRRTSIVSTGEMNHYSQLLFCAADFGMLVQFNFCASGLKYVIYRK